MNDPHINMDLVVSKSHSSSDNDSSPPLSNKPNEKDEFQSKSSDNNRNADRRISSKYPKN